MKKVTINLDDLTMAMDDSYEEVYHYLDTENGEVISIGDEIQRELEAIYVEAGGAEGAEALDITDIVHGSNIPDWRKAAVLEAHQVEMGYGTRYLAIPKADSREGYRDMENFINTVRDQQLEQQLWHAIQGRGAFGRFKAVLGGYPRERERWFQFKTGRLRERAEEWLAEEEIEPTFTTYRGTTNS
jgi:hypothetical protein